MKSKQTAISAAIVAALGITTGAIEPASAAFGGLDGEYDLVIKTTPTWTTYYGTAFKIGIDGAWQSSFTFGNLPGPNSNGMEDTGATVNGNGSGIAGDGYAGILRINVSNKAFSVSSFNKDTIFATAGGDFAQYLLGSGTSQMSGTINPDGSMTYDPTERYGAIDAPIMNDNRWHVNDVGNGTCGTPDGSTAWGGFTTGSITTPAGTISGADLKNQGDLNGDSIDDFQGVLVSGNLIGTDWGDFCGATYFETWRINLLARAINDSTTVSAGTALAISVLANDGVGGGVGPLTVISATNGSLGTTAVTGGGTTVTYTAGGAGGSDSLTYTTQDGNGVQSTATINITVTANPVAAGNDGPFSGNQNATLSIAISTLTSNDNSTAGTIVDATLLPTSPTVQGGTAVLNGVNVDYTPPSPDFIGSDSFTYTVDDAASNTSDPATVSINITAYGVTDAGSYAPGAAAAAAGSANGSFAGDSLPVDTGADASCVGGCFDFVITGAANTTQVVPPQLSLPIVEGLTLRKYINSTWQDFDVSAGDSIASAPMSTSGGCPAPGATSWVAFNGATSTAANVGHTCLRYTIADDGPNDANVINANTIADPSGLASAIQQIVKSGLQKNFESNTGGGCTIGSTNNSLSNRTDWLLIGGLLGLLGWFRRKLQR